MPVDMKKYRTAERYRARIIRNQKRYNKTKKGKESNRKARKKFVKKGYYVKYMKKKRRKARKEGICLRCFKREVVKDLTICRECMVNGSSQ